MFAPFGASAQTRSAPAKVAPDVMPTKMPSFCASSWRQRIASGARDRDDAVDHLHGHGIGGQLRDEVRRPALHRMRLEGRMRRRRASRRHCAPARCRCRAAGASSGSHTMIFVSGISFAQHARDALQRAAGAIAGHPVVEPLALEVLDDLARGGAGMDSRGWPRSRTGGSGTSRASWRARPPCRPCRRRARRAGVSTTLAPRKRISLRRSTLNCSAMVTTSG